MKTPRLTLMLAVLAIISSSPLVAEEKATSVNADDVLQSRNLLLQEVNVNNGLICSKNVGLLGSYYSTDLTTFLENHGHTVTMETAQTISNGSLSNLDVLYINRNGVLDATNHSSEIEAWVRSGGKLITEFDATELLFDGTFGLFNNATKDLDWSVPSGDVLGGNTINIVNSSHPIATGLPASFVSGDPIGVFKVYYEAELDPELDRIARLDGDTNEDGADDLVVASACIDSGQVIPFFTDFGDWSESFGLVTPQEEMLLLNAICDKCITEVAIDIKPGGYPNSINLSSGGATPVAILGSESLDVSLIDTSTLALGTASVKTVGKSDKLLCSIEDITGNYESGPEGIPDGFDDLVCHFVTMEIAPDEGGTSATLTGNFLPEAGGGALMGVDTVNIVP
ncbi:hypothetical protein [Vibrio sp. YIC-376]|uniref:hypothetical protein n=1 Tax=Vibrio sp. YIC-376 TaxID=3136162 RepID=UPI00402A9D01